MLKVVIALSVAQTLAIGFLAARIVEFDERLHNTERTFVENAAAQNAILSRRSADSASAVPAQAIIAEAASSAPGSDEIRNIIRQEFATLRAGGAPVVAEKPATAPADPRRLTIARRSLDGLIAKHDVAPRDIDLYLDALAELPEAERKAGLRSLARAMNDGRINGHF